MRRFMSAVPLMFLPFQAGAECMPPPLAPCQILNDVNCDGKDDRHCRIGLDTDSTAFGDCTPNGFEDDFWTFMDGDDDGVACPGDPDDVSILVPDGLGDGVAPNPYCDFHGFDFPQALGVHSVSGNITFYTPTVPSPSPQMPLDTVDAIRGEVSQLSFGATTVDLGTVVCIVDDYPQATAITDPTIPPLGIVYFYTVRWTDGQWHGYGFGECMERFVQVGNGDCGVP